MVFLSFKRKRKNNNYSNSSDITTNTKKKNKEVHSAVLILTRVLEVELREDEGWGMKWMGEIGNRELKIGRGMIWDQNLLLTI